MSTPVDAFTISSNNYLGMARVFAESYLEYHPGSKVFVCLVDRPDTSVRYGDFPFEMIAVEDLGIPAFKNFAFRYDILELNTAVKPFVFKYLGDHYGLERAYYFDPDILIHDHLGILESSLEKNQCVLTPHLTQPLDNHHRPPERVIRQCGIYNLGFVGLQLNDSTEAFLDWWCDRLYRNCVIDLPNGVFVDQSWMDFAPAYLDSVAIVRDPIFNVAYWNIPSRHPKFVRDHWEIDGRRVGFFHFSGVDVDRLDEISRHQNRIDLWKRPELRPLFEEYRNRVQESGQYLLRKKPYAWSRFTGTAVNIPECVREGLHAVDPSGQRWHDPFEVDCDDSYLAWLVEPLCYRNTAVHRAALMLWSGRPDARRAFPDLDGADLLRFVDWYLGAGAEEADLHDVFVAPLRAARESVCKAPADPEILAIAKIDLSDPGGWTDWLNEPVGGRGLGCVTRLALAVVRTRQDVSVLYPDPTGVDRLKFCYWMVTHGSREYDLHPSLVHPIRESLPTRARVSSRVRTAALNFLRQPHHDFPNGPDDGSQVLTAESRRLAVLGRDVALRRGVPKFGVNVVGFFSGEKGPVEFASSLCDRLRFTGTGCSEVSFDCLLPEDMTFERNKFHDGVPFPVTLLTTPPGTWLRTLSLLPLTARIGGRIAGYYSGPADKITDDVFSSVNEIWVPTEKLEGSLRERSPMPVFMVPPLVEMPDPENAPRYVDSRGGPRWFLAIDLGAGDEDELALSAAIDCARLLQAKGITTVGVRLVVGRENARLKVELQHLGVEVVVEGRGPSKWIEHLSGCAGYLHLYGSRRMAPTPVQAMLAGFPVAGWNGSEAEWLTDLEGGGPETGMSGGAGRRRIDVESVADLVLSMEMHPLTPRERAVRARKWAEAVFGRRAATHRLERRGEGSSVTTARRSAAAIE